MVEATGSRGGGDGVPGQRQWADRRDAVLLPRLDLDGVQRRRLGHLGERQRPCNWAAP